MQERDLGIQEPCPLATGGLEGTGAQKWCPTCKKTVHDISLIGPEAAGELLARGGVCVRGDLDDRGQVVFRTRRSRAWTLSLGTAVVLGATVPAYASITTEPGQVGLLDWLWEQVLGEEAEEVTEAPVLVVEPEDTGLDWTPEDQARQDALRDLRATQHIGGAVRRRPVSPEEQRRQQEQEEARQAAERARMPQR
jgi:hypothetical protein